MRKKHTYCHSHTKLYNVWCSMRRRCFDKKNKDYRYYGAKGISVCEDWIGFDGADNFCKWAHENGYEEGLTIDRIDSSGNYCPNNCRWVPMSVQNHNHSKPINITYGEMTMNISEWARFLKIPKPTLVKRIQILKWPVEEAFGIKSHERRSRWN